MREPTVCMKALRPPFFATAARTGASIPELCASVDVPPTVLVDLSARVPHRTVVRVWDAFAERCDDPGFGLSAAALLGVPDLDLVDYVLQRSPTIRALLASFIRYQRLFHDANDVHIEERTETLVLCHRFSGSLPRARHLVEFIMSMWVLRLRSLLGAEPQRVYLQGPPMVARERYRAAFGPNVVFDAAFDGVELARDAIDAPLRMADPSAAASFASHLEEELGKLAVAAFADTARAEITRLLRAGSADAFDLDVVARGLGMSRRTLQRRLLEGGSSFRAVVDTARRDLAVRELQRGVATVTDVAFLLGFSEHSAFSRAFRRWTGESPASYVRTLSPRG